jgi:peroxiredoxin
VSAWIAGKRPVSGVLRAALALAVAAVIVIAAVYARAPRATRVHVGEMAPDFELPAVTDAPPTKLSGNRGGPTLLIFIDTRWLGSDAYVRYLERMHRRYFRRGLRTTAVAVDRDPALVREFVRRNHVTFAVVSDPFAAKLAPSWGTPKDPEAYLLDPALRVEVVLLERVDWTSPKVRDFLAKYLQPGPPGW